MIQNKDKTSTWLRGRLRAAQMMDPQNETQLCLKMLFSFKLLQFIVLHRQTPFMSSSHARKVDEKNGKEVIIQSLPQYRVKYYFKAYLTLP